MNELNMWTGSRFPLLENKKNGEKEKKSTFFAMTMDMETTFGGWQGSLTCTETHYKCFKCETEDWLLENSTLVVLY